MLRAFKQLVLEPMVFTYLLASALGTPVTVRVWPTLKDMFITTTPCRETWKTIEGKLIPKKP